MNGLTNSVVHLILTFLLLSSALIGQLSDCGYDQAFKSLKASDPIFQQRNQAYENAYQNYTKAEQDRSFQIDEFLNLPIVFHVIHHGDSLGSANNPRDEIFIKAVDFANQLFRHSNKEVEYQNPHYGVDTEISFCIAGETLTGAPSVGIVRYLKIEGELILASDVFWDRDHYINILIGDDENTCGSYKGGSDYIFISQDCLLKESVLAHELGHYLSLKHTFHVEGVCDNEDCLSDGDFVCDTPPQETRASMSQSDFEGQPCLHPGNSCQSDEDDISEQNPYRSITLGGMGDQPDANNNIMGYGISCHSTFTAGQAARMKFNLVEERKNLRAISSGCSDDVVFETDAAIDKIYITGLDECGYEISVFGELKNCGDSDLKSQDIFLFAEHVVIDSLQWEGFLKPGNSASFSFDSVATNFGVNQYEVRVQQANSILDGNSNNDRNFAKYSFNNVTKTLIGDQSRIIIKQDTIEIGLDLSGMEDEFYFHWWREGGLMEQDQQGKPIIEVSQADRYYVEVYSENYTCVWTETILVKSINSISLPQIYSSEFAINCRTPEIQLWDYGASDYNVEWHSRDGFIEEDFISLLVDSAGDYRVKAIHDITGHVLYSEWFTVVDLRDSISIELAVTGEISCTNKEVQIEAFSSDIDFLSYTFIWKDLRDGERVIAEGETPFITVSEPGRYGVEARHKDFLFSCEILRELEVFGSSDIPIVHIKMPDFSDFANTDTIRLDATQSDIGVHFNYQWTSDHGEIIDGENTLSPLVKGYGEYTLILKNEAKDCIHSSAINLIPSHGIDLYTYCYSFGSSYLYLTIEGSHGFLLDPIWVLPSGLESQENVIIINEAGSYSVRYFNGVDWIYDTVFIDQKYLEVPLARVDGITTTDCMDEEYVLSGEKSDYIEGDIFLWTTNNDSILGEGIELSFNGDGSFYLNAISQYNYCSSRDYHTVRARSGEVSAAAGPDIILDCDQGSAFLGLNEADDNLEFKWFYLEENDSIYLDNTPTMQVELSGKYLLELFDKDINCYSYDEVEVFYGEEVEVDIVSRMISDSCLDYSIVLFVDNFENQSDYRVRWTLPNGETSDRFFQPANQSGVYIADYFSTTSTCTKSDSFYFEPIQDLDIDIASQDVSCFGANDGMIYATAVGGLPPYTWADDNDGRINILPGTFTYRLSDSLGCHVEHEVTVDEPPMLEINQFLIYEDQLLADIAGGTPPYTYNWNTNSTQEGIQSPIFNEYYSVTITDANGCTETQETEYLIPPDGEAIILMPNPASDNIQIYIQSGGPIEEIKIYNTHGVCIKTIQNYQLLDIIDISQLRSGVYLAVLSNKSMINTIKFVKE